MKARNKKTGEIVEVERWGSDGSYTVYRNSEGDSINLPVSFYDNFEEIVEAEDAIDWEQRRYEIAKEMMPHTLQRLCEMLDRGESVDNYGLTLRQYVALDSVRYADALVEELKNRR